MLTIGSHGGAGGASEYFDDHLDRGDYYVASPGRWHSGKAARALGLPRQVTADHFFAAAEGCSPDGRPLVQRAGAQHRAGWDLCFSCPKSVSVVWSQAGAGQRAAIARAHERAVDAALALLQQEAARVRVGKGGVAQVSGELLAALFTHETSRAGDPQLHTHCFVNNCALRPDGKWGTLESRCLYTWQTVVGTAYRAQLAHELRLLGYGIAKDNRAFGVVGVPDRACREFSQRRNEILRAADESGVSTPAGMEVIALATRDRKVDVDQAVLCEDWRERGHSVGFGAVEAAQLRGTPNIGLDGIDTDELLASLTAHNAVFRVQDVWRAVSEKVQTAGGGIARVQSLVRRLLQSDELVAVRGERYTTRTMLELERRAMAAARELTLLTRRSCSANNAKRTLSAEQTRALRHVLGDSGIAVVEGRAGTGKSFMLGAARECWQHAGVRVIGAALSGKAAQGLQDGSGIRSQTLHSLLAEIESGKLRLDARTVLVIDEAGMVGTSQMQRLLGATAAASAKVVLVGDSCQLQSIDAGGVFRRLSRELGAAEMAEIRRQRDAADRAIVVDLMEGRAGAAIAQLNDTGRVHVSDGQPTVIASMVRDWARVFNPANPGASLMLAATRADVRGINTEARRVRQEAGALGSQEILVGGNAFSTGDRVLFLRNDRVLGVKNGTLGTVRSISDRSLVIDIDDGQSVTVDPAMYPHLTHGYAVTVHKAQGVTADHVLVFLSDQMASREWGYVAGSRHRHELHIYADRSVYAGIAEDLSRSEAKSMAIDELPGNVAPIPDGYQLAIGDRFESGADSLAAASAVCETDDDNIEIASTLPSDTIYLPLDNEEAAPML